MRKITRKNIGETKEVPRSRDTLKNPPKEQLGKKMGSNLGGSRETLK